LVLEFVKRSFFEFVIIRSFDLRLMFLDASNLYGL
jgi:hypothetical protein